MLKRTLYFSNPFYLSTRLRQLVIAQPMTGQETTIPIEDIGFIILDHREISVSATLVNRLAEYNVSLVFCNETHHPASMMLPLDHHRTQAERYRHQTEAPAPLKKQLWAQTIRAKIGNQQRLFGLLAKETQPFSHFLSKVKSGDTGNAEAIASRHYWQRLFSHLPQVKDFRREREGPWPNNLLNFGYTVLRSAVARALVGSGLLPSLGIHHRNRYNAYPLADDIMEPYRPWVDRVVVKMTFNKQPENELDRNSKAELISVITHDTEFSGEKSPLMVAIENTTSSLAKCFLGVEKSLSFPVLV